MNILAMDTSAKSASVAYLRDGKILGQFYINSGLTHSTTVMPMLENLLKTANLSLSDTDCFAVSVGPGSFTGLRIGISAIKGLSFAENKPCVGVSTLEAIACNFIHTDSIVCAVIDARCKRFFCAFFRCSKDGTIQRITSDKVLSYEEIADFIEKNYPDDTLILSGDGTETAYALLKDRVENLETAPEQLRYQQSTGVAFIAEKKVLHNETVTPQQLLPLYITLPQAQRELQKKSDS